VDNKDLIVEYTLVGELYSVKTDVADFLETYSGYKMDNLKKYMENPPRHLVIYHPDDKKRRKSNIPTDEQLEYIARCSAYIKQEWDKYAKN